MARPAPAVVAAAAAGVGGDAAHGVIRTAHAVRSLRSAGADPHPLLVNELAQGFALWAARFQCVPGAPALSGDLDVGRGRRGAATAGSRRAVAGAGDQRAGGLPSRMKTWPVLSRMTSSTVRRTIRLAGWA